MSKRALVVYVIGYVQWMIVSFAAVIPHAYVKHAQLFSGTALIACIIAYLGAQVMDLRRSRRRLNATIQLAQQQTASLTRQMQKTATQAIVASNKISKL